MNETIEKVHEDLIKLQSVLRKKFDLEAQVEALPVNLQTLKKELAAANEVYLELTTRYNDYKDKAFAIAHKYEEAVENRTNSEQKMGLISTLRESELLTKEIEEAKIQEKNFLKAKKSIGTTLSEIEEALQIQEAETTRLKELFEAESEKNGNSLAEIQKQIAIYDAECAEINSANNVTPEIFTKFSNIVKHKNGVGIVPVHSEVCTGCNMVLPSQFVNDVRSNVEIEYCPYCSRILYYEETNDVLDLDLDIDGADDSSFESFADGDDDFDI